MIWFVLAIFAIWVAWLVISVIVRLVSDIWGLPR